MHSSETPTGITITLRDIVRFLFKWWRSIVAITITVVVIVTTLVYLAPQTYTAKAKVLIESINAMMTQSNPLPGVDMDVALNTEAEILMSRPVIAAAVDILELDKMVPKETGFNGLKRSFMRMLAGLGLLQLTNERENWIAGILDKAKVKAVPRSNVLELRFAFKDPKLGADIVNTVTDEFVKHHVSVYTGSDITDFYAQGVAEARQRLSDLEQKLNDLRSGYTSSASSAALTTVTQTAADLRQQESALRSELLDLRTRYDEGHEKVDIAKRKLELLRAQLEATDTRLKEMDLIQDDVAALESQIKAERDSYQRLVSLMDNASMAKRATAGIANVRIIEYATPPATPDFPRLLFVIAACFGGVGLALGVALVREYFDQHVDRIDVAEEILGYPIFAAIPCYRPDQSPEQ